MSKPLLISVILLLSVLAKAGWSADSESDSVQVVDTVLFGGEDLLQHASPVTSDIDFEKRMYQNPTAGLFKSMVIPGWGQLGNRRYLKAILFAGLDAWFISSAVRYGRQASDYYDQYESTIDVVDRRELYNLYLDRKDSRNKYTWFAVIVTFISMFDAYVDAHLSGYPHKAVDDLTLEVRPMKDGGFLASISLDF